LGRNNHGHLAAFHGGKLFDLGDLRQIILDPSQHGQAAFLVGHFPATKSQGDFDFIAFAQKLLHRPHFHIVIVRINAGAHLDLFDADGFLLLARGTRLLLFLESEFSKIEDLADWRIRIW
jgi:hypothetical protein